MGWPIWHNESAGTAGYTVNASFTLVAHTKVTNRAQSKATLLVESEALLLGKAVTCLQAKSVLTIVFQVNLFFLHCFLTFCASAYKMTLNSVVFVVNVIVCISVDKGLVTECRRQKPALSLVCGQSLMLSDIVWTLPHVNRLSLDRPQTFSGSTTVAVYWVKHIQQWPLASREINISMVVSSTRK